MAQILMILMSILAIAAQFVGGGAPGGFAGGPTPQVAFAAGPAPAPAGLTGTTMPAGTNLGQTLQAGFVPAPMGGGATGPGTLNPDPGTAGQVVASGPASHYLGPDDNRPTNPQTGGRVEPAAQSGYMVDGSMPTAAMKTVPLGTKVRVTNLDNNQSVIVRINDRGPYVGNRVIDLTYSAFSVIADPKRGVIDRVRVEALPPETPTSWNEQLLTVNDWRQISGSNRLA